MSGVRVVIFGGSGFVGQATVAALRERAVDPLGVRTPRLSPVAGAQVREAALAEANASCKLARTLHGADTVINAAGLPDATSSDESSLYAANAAWPGALAKLCAEAGVSRLVHVSSAAVQGDQAELNDGPAGSGFSPYSRSKALGELLVQELGPGGAVIYRPPGVHSESRETTRTLARLATSPGAVVARPGTDPTPQALLVNVASAVAYLATCSSQPPPVVIHPWEGVTTADLLEMLAGRPPRQLPRRLASMLVAAVKGLGRTVPDLAAQGRRLEVLLFGQQQAASWLTLDGWRPPVGPDGWREIGRTLSALRALRE